MPPYNDGKAPIYKIRSPWGKSPGHKAADVTPGSGSAIASSPTRQVPSVAAPSANGGGLFKAHDCIPGKGGM